MWNIHLADLMNAPDGIVHAAANPGLSGDSYRALFEHPSRRYDSYDEIALVFNLACNPSLDEDTLRRLVRRSDDSKRNDTIGEVLASRDDLPVDVAEQLSRKNQKFASALARNPTIPATLLHRLIGCTETAPSRWYEDETSYEAIQNPGAPSAVIDAIAAEESVGLRLLVAGHPALGHRAANILAADLDRRVRLIALSHPAASPPQIAAAADSDDTETRAAAAANPSLSTATLRELAADRQYRVRMAVASNPSTPPEVLSTLTCDVPGVFRSLGANPSTPRSTLLELLNGTSIDAYHAIMDRNDIAWNEHELGEFAEGAATFRYLAAKSPATPEATLLTLAGDDNHWVLKTVAANPACPIGGLEKIASNIPDIQRDRIVENLLANPNAAIIIEDALNTTTPNPRPANSLTL